jgi:cell division inhibitor SepF
MAGIWRKTLIYLGLVEDDELDDYGYDDLMEPEEPVGRRSRRQGADGLGARGDAVVRPLQTSAQARFHLVHPRSFNDAQEVGDKFREGFSVIMNLSTADTDLSRRLIDFASGLAYGLGGAMQPVADRVFLVTPSGVQVSAEERRRLLEERGFFNQA